MASKLQSRSNEVELMDDLGSSGAIIEQALRELELINKLLGGNHVTLDGLKKLLARSSDLPAVLTIVDLGCGGGDMLKLIAKWGRKRGQKMKLIGIDANPHIVEFARQNTRDYPEISYNSIDIFSDAFRTLNFDVATATLFTHHFSDQQLVKLFKQLRQQAQIGIVINDLHRHKIAYYSIKFLTAVFSKSPMVRNDAAVSVSRAFVKTDIQKILNASGIANYTLHWMWAFRWQIVAKLKK